MLWIGIKVNNKTFRNPVELMKFCRSIFFLLFLDLDLTFQIAERTSAS